MRLQIKVQDDQDDQDEADLKMSIPKPLKKNMEISCSLP